MGLGDRNLMAYRSGGNVHSGGDAHLVQGWPTGEDGARGLDEAGGGQDAGELARAGGLLGPQADKRGVLAQTDASLLHGQRVSQDVSWRIDAAVGGHVARP